MAKSSHRRRRKPSRSAVWAVRGTGIILLAGLAFVVARNMGQTPAVPGPQEGSYSEALPPRDETPPEQAEEPDGAAINANDTDTGSPREPEPGPEPMRTPERLGRETYPIRVEGEGLTKVEILDEVAVADVKRLGLNLGSRTWYGAAQFIKNLIDNPGFEAAEYGMMFHTDDGSRGNRIVQAGWDTSWNNPKFDIGQPEGFWTGAHYEFVYGPAKGRKGRISGFAHRDNKNVFLLDTDGPNPDKFDVVVARMEYSNPGYWGEWAEPDTSATRPGSPGRQSLKLNAADETWKASYAFGLDSYWRDGDRSAGKLLIIRGPYRLAFWAKGASDESGMRVVFQRGNAAKFFDETIALSPSWQHYEFERTIPEGRDSLYGDSQPEIISLLFYVTNPEDTVWVDDAELYRADDTNPTVFTDPFVDYLKDLRPGVLRDWANQLGSSLDNQLAVPWARKVQGFKPHSSVAREFTYSIHEFLQLCELVGSEPWYVIPPTCTPAECANLVEYLAGPADGRRPYADKRAALGRKRPWTEQFPVVHLEYGNEMWGAASGGDPFFGASAMGGERLGALAQERFAAMKAHPNYDPERISLIIGGQYGYPGRQAEIERASDAHDEVAIAPYFGVLEVFGSEDEIYGPLFANPFFNVGKEGPARQCRGFLDQSERDTKMPIYEINFHTTDGPAPIGVRNDFLTGMGGGVALPLHMLVYLRDLGVRTQCAFAALQYSMPIRDGEYARVWGMLRDIEATRRKRPTWLGVELANRAIRGDMLATRQSGANPYWDQAPINAIQEPTRVNVVQSFAFRDESGSGALLFNLDLRTPREVRLAAPGKVPKTASMYRLAPEDIHADNERDDRVAIQRTQIDDFATPYDMALPPHSVTAVIWAGTR